MKNVHILSCLLLTSVILHGMEQNSLTAVSDKKDELWQNIDWKLSETALKNNCKSYLKDRLDEYKKSETASPDSMMDQIKEMSSYITGIPSYFNSVMSKKIHDDLNNSFLHHAVKKGDLPIVKWLLNNKCSSTHSNAESNAPIDLCIAQLMPSASGGASPENSKKIAYEILDALTEHYGMIYMFNSTRERYIRKLIRLQLEHTKTGVNCVLKDYFLQRLSEEKTFNKTIDLSKIYQIVTDEHKNTFSHVFVQEYLSDELYDFIQKDYISFGKNDQGKTPFDEALEKFQHFTQKQDPAVVRKNYPDMLNKKRCCFFMLLNYLKKKNNIEGFIQCCDKHII